MGTMNTGNVPFLEVAGKRFVDLDNMKILTAGGQHASSVTLTFKTPGGVAYQVPAGKKLRVVAMRVASETVSAFNLGYGDTDVGIGATGAQPTNAVWDSGQVSAATIGTVAGFVNAERDAFFEVPAGKYPCVYSASAAQSYARIYCYELPA